MNTIKKKIRIVLFAVSLLYCFFAKAQSCPCPDTPMTEPEFNEYIRNYEDLFVTPGGHENHTKWIFLSRNYFVLLDSFLKKDTACPGFTFHFVCHNTIIDANQQSSADQILFSIAAGYGTTSLQNDVLYLFHQTVDLLWSPDFSQAELSTRRRAGRSFIGPFHTLHADPNAIHSYKQKYSDTAAKYTASVFVCKKQIKQIRAYLKLNPTYKGVKLYFGSYNKKIECLDQKDIQQFTLILLPVENKNSKGNFGKYLKFLENKFLNDYYNHGSLCPNSCN